ncbi:mas-related G-protein coupled receptor member H-like [Pleurodeles waltl]|uniref:mas-related G-protein coupled receptor member H-like n=1 Tax=Pleurodeles waltl TaxID=8319 RepID=UPI0037093DAA
MESGNMSYNDSKLGSNGTQPGHQEALSPRIHLLLLFIDLVICVFGLVGNGVVIWFLSFKMKRNSCRVYILNLAVADFTFVVGSLVNLIHLICTTCDVTISDTDSDNLLLITKLMYNFGFNTSCFILAAISVERCLAVLFPVEYQNNRPKHLSGIISVLLWILSCLVTGLEYFFCRKVTQVQAPGNERCTPARLFTSALYLLLTLLCITSSLVLLVETRKTSKQCHPRRLYVVILSTVLIFFLWVVPARLLHHLVYFRVLQSPSFSVYFFYVQVTCNSIHCSSNPYIYFLVGTWRKRGLRGCIKQALERVFKADQKTSGSKEKLRGSDTAGTQG